MHEPRATVFSDHGPLTTSFLWSRWELRLEASSRCHGRAASLDHELRLGVPMPANSYSLFSEAPSLARLPMDCSMTQSAGRSIQRGVPETAGNSQNPASVTANWP